MDVWACHSVGGTVGTVLTGVFAAAAVNGLNGLLEGNLHQFGFQLLAVLFAIACEFGMTWLILKVISWFGSVRLSENVESKGLDEESFGAAAHG